MDDKLYSPVPIIYLAKNSTTYKIVSPISPLDKNKKSKKITKPFFSSICLVYSEIGKKAKSSFEPSKGGIGNKLNTISAILIINIRAKILAKRPSAIPVTNSILKEIPLINASIKFDNGPATPTIAGPYL